MKHQKADAKNMHQLHLRKKKKLHCAILVRCCALPRSSTLNHSYKVHCVVRHVLSTEYSVVLHKNRKERKKKTAFMRFAAAHTHTKKKKTNEERCFLHLFFFCVCVLFPVPVFFVLLFVVGNEIIEKERKQRKTIDRKSVV